MFINNFIYFYIGICVMLIIFELLWSQYIKMYNIQMRKLKIKYKEQILAVERYHKKIDLNILFKELKHVNFLIAFQTALEEVSKKKECSELLHQVLPVFMRLNRIYALRKNDMEKAYFAYVIGKNFTINNIQKTKQLLETMYSFLNSKSLYCRTNALSAIFRIGKINHVLKAIQIIDTNGILYHNNLLTKNMKNFTGNKKILAIELLKTFDSYKSNTQVAIVKFLTEYNYDFEEIMLEILKIPLLNVNVKCEIMRFFQVNRSDKAKEYLISQIDKQDLIANDLTIKTIGTLGYYDEVDVRKVLEKLKKSNDEYLLEAAYRSLEKMETLSVV